MANLFDALNEFDSSLTQKVKEYSGILGLPTSNKTVSVPDRNGYVYVRLRDNESEIIQAYNEEVSPVWNLPVIIVRQGGGWRITGRDVERYSDWGSSSAFIPEHHYQHEFNPDAPGGDIVFVYDNQFVPLLVTPSGTSGGPNVIIQPYTFRKSDGSFTRVGGTGTVSLLPYKPLDGQARMVMVYLNRDTGNHGLLINSGTSFAANITGTAAILPYLPIIPSSSYEPLYGVRLVSGTQAIQWSNLYSLRQFFGGSSSGSSGGGISEAPIDGKVYGRKDADWTEVSGTGGSTPTFDANRVVITDDSGNQTVDAQFYYDFDLNLLIIGSNSIPIQSPNMGNIVGISGSPSWNLWSYGSELRGLVAFEKALGTEDVPLPVTHGTPLGRLSWRGFDGHLYSWGITRAQLEARALGDFVSGSNAGTQLVGSITASGTTTMQDFLAVNQAGADILYGKYRISGSAYPTYADVSDNDPNTDVTGSELETLTDGSNADGLHKHAIANATAYSSTTPPTQAVTVSPAAWVKVSNVFDLSDDDNGWWSDGNKRFDLPAGKFYVGAYLVASGIADQALFIVAVYKNGSFYRLLGRNPQSGTALHGVGGNALIESDGDDYFEIYCYSSDTNYTLTGDGSNLAYCHFDVIQLSTD